MAIQFLETPCYISITLYCRNAAGCLHELYLNAVTTLGGKQVILQNYRRVPTRIILASVGTTLYGKHATTLQICSRVPPAVMLILVQVRNVAMRVGHRVNASKDYSTS